MVVGGPRVLVLMNGQVTPNVVGQCVALPYDMDYLTVARTTSQRDVDLMHAVSMVEW